MNDCTRCGCENVQLVRQQDYISEALKSVKLFRCLSCRKYFIAIDSYFELLNNQDKVDCVYFMHPINRTQGHRWFRILTTDTNLSDNWHV